MENTNELTLWQDEKQIAEVKAIYGKDLTDGEFKIFRGIGMVTNLNPYLREIWAVKYGTSPASIFIGRDGYRKAAQGNPEYDFHIVDAVYANDDFKVEDGAVRHSYNVKERGALVGAYCSVKRKSASKPMFTYVELKEYTTGKSLWQTKPATMIKKVAEAQGLRMAFQDIFAGTYDESEQWEQKKGNDTPKGDVIDVETVTANGNPRGTMTEQQNAKVYALISELGGTKEQADDFTMERFGCRVSGLSKEQAVQFIDALEKKVQVKYPPQPNTPELQEGDEEGEMGKDFTMSTEDAVEMLGGKM